MSSVSTIPVVFEMRQIYYKHRDGGFYPTSAAVVAQMLIQAPVQAIEALIFTVFAYFLSGLSSNKEGYYYLVFYGICCLTSLTTSQYYRLVTYTVSGLPEAQILAALSVLLMVAFSGLLISQPDIPIYWIWLYWFNPLAWAFRALVVNEFTSPTPDYQEIIIIRGEPTLVGDALLQQLDFTSDRIWILYAFLYLLCLWALMLVLTTVAMHFIRWKESKHHPLDESKKSNQVQNGADGPTAYSGDSYILMEDPPCVMTFIPVTLTFTNIWYSVRIKRAIGRAYQRDVLMGISAYIKPGEMTLLMGSSGMHRCSQRGLYTSK